MALRGSGLGRAACDQAARLPLPAVALAAADVTVGVHLAEHMAQKHPSFGREWK